MKTVDDIPGWFHKDVQDYLDKLIKEHDIKDVIEVGSFVGKSTAFFAQRVEHVWAIDPFMLWEEGKENGDAQQFGEDFYMEFLKNMNEAGVIEKISPIRMTSLEAAEYVFTGGSADLVYIDAAHDYESVKQDIKLWVPFAKKFICGDDYDENWPGVMQAVDEIYPQREVFDNLWIAPILGNI